MPTPLAHQFSQDLRANGDKPMQICLPFTGPLGPGQIQRGNEDGIYVIETQAQMGQGPHAKVVTLPVTFAADDLIWYSTGARVQEQPLVVPLGGGGLVVPRG